MNSRNKTTEKSFEILCHPNPILEKKAKKIKDPLSSEIQKLIPQMIRAMKESNGIGLAAPQVGKSIRLCIIEEGESVFVFINPKIKSKSKETIISEEGCLSFPGKFIPVERHARVKVRYLNEKGEQVKIKADGLLAKALQHEIDHLEGVLFIKRKKSSKK